MRHEMEGNEIILTKGVYENPVLRAAASMINEMGGGRSFASGGPVNPLSAVPAPYIDLIKKGLAQVKKETPTK